MDLARLQNIRYSDISDDLKGGREGGGIFGLSVEAKRIKDVVEVLSARPKPRKEDVQEFFSPLGGEAEGSAETETIARRLSRKMINGCGALATKLFLDWSRMAFKLSP